MIRRSPTARLWRLAVIGAAAAVQTCDSPVGGTRPLRDRASELARSTCPVGGEARCAAAEAKATVLLAAAKACPANEECVDFTGFAVSCSWAFPVCGTAVRKDVDQAALLAELRALVPETADCAPCREPCPVADCLPASATVPQCLTPPGVCGSVMKRQ
jgi:hypothetical protein